MHRTESSSHSPKLNEPIALGPFQRWTAVSSIALIAVTWRLWTPQAVYPQVPVFASLCDASRWLDWFGLVGVLVGLSVLVVTSRLRWCAVASGLVLVALMLLFSLDQHRFQPWAYELALFCTVWLTCRGPWRLRLMRCLLISVYFYSALGKFDFEFLHTVGQQMLGTLASWVGVDVAKLSMGNRLLLVATFPLVELAIALGLLWQRSRNWVGWLAVVLHCGLIAILGPLGMNHRFGVLLWNLQVAGQVYWLFVVKQADAPEQTPLGLRATFSNWMGATVIGAALALPFTERSGLWDHWPSWALYAPHSSRVQVDVRATAIERLPESLQKQVSRPAVDADEMALWISVPIDVWSLETLDTPIYPQARFQLGVAEVIARAVNSDFEVRVTLLGTASRMNGTRYRETFTGLHQLSKGSGRYWVNTHPRNYGSAQP